MEQAIQIHSLRPYFTPNLIEAGVDEVGRGSLAGPVVAAAVILPKDYFHPKLNDSKLLSEEEREMVKTDVLNNCLDYGIGEVDNQRIDEINILYASFLAMHAALDKLKIRPELILVDGNKFLPYNFIPYHCEIKGDSKFTSIAAASILAKCHRDEVMRKLSKNFLTTTGMKMLDILPKSTAMPSKRMGLRHCTGLVTKQNRQIKQISFLYFIFIPTNHVKHSIIWSSGCRQRHTK